MDWGEIALGVVTLGMLGSIGHTILLARSIERNEQNERHRMPETLGTRHTAAMLNIGKPQPRESGHR